MSLPFRLIAGGETLTELQLDRFSKFELIAAIQAGLIYIIMRAIDGVKERSSEIIEMLLTCQVSGPIELGETWLVPLMYNVEVLVEHLKKTINQTICCHFEQLRPSPNWGEWVFAETQRRYYRP